MSIEDRVAEAGPEFKEYILKNYKVPWHTLSDETLREALEEFNKTGAKTVFTADELREHWGKGTNINYKGTLYRVGKMSYGDYFLEPFNPKYPLGKGEREPFEKGTLWLEKIEKDPYHYKISNPEEEIKKKGKHLGDTSKKIRHLKGEKCVKHIDIQKYVIQGVKHYRARVRDEDWKYEIRPGETLDMFRGRIMDTLNCGIVTHFIEDWEVGKHLK